LDESRPFDLSQGQRALWFLHRLAPDSSAYNLAAAVRIPGGLDDIAALRRALHGMAARHPALRTTFHVADGRPFQRVGAEPRVDLTEHDATGWSEERLEEALAREAWRPFDLETGPLLRASLLRRPGEDRLVLVVHHVAADLWSVAILWRDLGALLAGHPLRPAPAATYADFVAAQEELLAGPRGDALRAFWLRALAGAPPVLELPFDRPRPAVQSFRGADETARLGAPLSEALAALARAEGATLYQVLLAAFQTLLGRYSGQDDFVLGSPAAGRTSTALARVVGYFVNPLPLRADLAGDPPFREAVARARRTALAAQEHQEYPFPLIAEQLPVPAPGQPPVFQVLLVFQRAPGPRDEGLTGLVLGRPGGKLLLGDLPVEALRLRPEASQLDWSLSLGQVEGELYASLQYDTALFDAATAARALGHLRRLLEGAVADPGARLSELPLLTEPERGQLLAWNATTREWPRAGSLHALVGEQAARTPEAVAVEEETRRLTYRELWARSGTLACRLQRMGVGAESRVAVCAERSLELVVGLLAVLRAGGAYVPLDPSYPSDRLAWMLADAEVAALLVQPGLLPAAVLPKVTLDLETLAAGSGEPEARACDESLAYVIYTSGSTGRPKGVMNAHRGIVNRLLWMRERFVLEPGEGVLQKTPVSFDVSVWELFWPLIAGGRLVLARPGGHQDPVYLSRRIERAGVTTAHFVPSMLRAFLAAGEPERCRSLRRVIASGEALAPDLVEAWYRACPWASLHNLYGPTEAAVEVTAWDCAPGEAPVPIGRPLPNTAVHVLDRHLRPLPVGVAGELCLGGVQVARGYLGRPDLTAERFVPDPESSQSGGHRLYRTGDLGRRRPDGVLEYLGRTDHQVKIRGFRIEPGEIEAALLETGEVEEAAVVARPHGGELRLVAYVVSREGGRIDELREHLRRRLPAHFVPSAWVELEALPRTPSGKLDRQALPEPERVASEDLAPRTPAEELLAGIFREVLGLERVGVRESFFELGGHSLMATQVASRVREAFGIELPLRAVFEAPTVEALALRIASERGGEISPPLSPGPLAGELPLSFSQQRLWFLDQLEPGSPLYNVAGGFRLRGDLSEPALASALDQVVRRHAALRTRFVSSQGRPAQVVEPEGRPELVRVDLRDLPAPLRERELARLAAEEARRPFDLSREALLRVRLVRLQERETALLVSMHHIVSDGWSLGVLAREVGALYRSLPLPELPVQYADFARWQRGKALEAQLDFWRRSLAGAPSLLELPTDRPRPAVADLRAGQVFFSLPENLWRDLQALAVGHRATPFLVLLAAFQALLGRHARQDDVAVGTPIANRNRLETEGLIGFFVNTLALRADLSGSPSFLDLLARVRETTLGAYAHQDLPFEKLVEELAPERSLDRTPLFQAMLVLAVGEARLDLPGVTAEPIAMESGLTKFDLTLFLEERDGGLAGRLQFRRDLFDAPRLARMAGHLRTLLEEIAADPRRAPSESDLLSPAERQAALFEWNDTGVAREPGLLHALVEAQAARTPEAPAVVFDGQSLSYRELIARSRALARSLRARGVGPEVPVGVSLARSLDLPVALLGILQAGGAWVPLDPDHPEDRLAFVREDTRLSLVIDRESLLALGEAAEIDERSWPGQAAYILYTSGSTGRPKGVVVSHEAIHNRILWAQSVYPLTSSDRVLQGAGLSFDFSVWELFAPLAAGACVVLPRPGEHRDTAALARLIAAEGVTVAHFVPSLFQAFLAEPASPTLERVLVGGEALSPELRDRFFDRFPGARLYNQYGPTEATVDATFHLCERGEPAVPIGRPIDNTVARVLDRWLHAAPPGIPGELCLGGTALARGYLGRPDLTAERFVPDPFSGKPGERLYRTGDLAVHLPDGSLRFLGRLDQQIKLRGVRIELGEIEAVLLRHPAVREAAVVLVAAPREQLVAYVVSRPGGTPGDLRAWLRGFLPDVMIPAAFVVLDTLPRTPGGKLDARSLPAPERVETEELAPRTPAEELLAGIFREVLGLERVGVRESFFELGGHSLLATQVASRVREAFGLELPLRAVFEAPTVEALALRIAREQGGESPPPLSPGSLEGELPLSFSQQRLWFLDQLEPGSPLYNVAGGFWLRGDLSEPALERSLDQVVRRHATLRTRFVSSEGLPAQVVEPEGRPDLARVDLRDLPAPLREAELVRLAAEEARRPFDLSRGSLLRVRLVRLAERETALLVSMHHIASDGWSLGVLAREVGALYRSLPLPELPVQYADFARWQRGRALDAQLDFWRRSLAGAPSLLELPTDRPRPAVADLRAGQVFFSLPENLWRDLQALAVRYRATPFLVLLAAFQALLGRHARQDDVVVGTPIANRNRLETEGLIGFFVNTLALRADLSGSPSFLDLLARVRETTLGAYAHQDLPFEKLVEELAPERSLDRTPLFQAMLVFGMGAARLDLPGVSAEPIAMDSGLTKFDLTLFLEERDGGLAGRLQFRRDLFDAPRLARMAGHLRALLEEIAADPRRAPAELDLLSPAERQAALFEWNDTGVAREPGLLHALVEAQAARTPEAPAVVFDGHSLSYRELIARSRALARRLRARGVGPEVPVGVSLERSLDLPVALLGILQAGGAWVPLDPDHPEERRAFVLEDARLSLVIDRESLLSLGEAVEIDERSWPEQAAYILYTSGSTGRPKGVVVSHEAIHNRILWAQSVYPLTSSDRVLQGAGLSFDFSAWELFAPLAAGACVVLPRPGEHRDTAALARLIAAESVTVAHFVPSLFQAFLAEPASPTLERVLVGGEALSPELRDRFFDRFPGARLYNQYGPTEATVDATFHLCERGEPVVPIGRPIDNTVARVLDRWLRAAPPGVAGELCLGGTALARGYLGRPDLTAERFVPDPFSGKPGERLYRTGDLAVHLPDGSLRFLGRLDQQIKLRGVRIEPGEIEAVLLRHPAVREAAVVLARAPHERLVAYVVPQLGEQPGDLRSWLRGFLPDVMIPTSFVVLHALPRTPGGKLDVGALPEPEPETPAGPEPQTPIEEIVAGIFARVLGLSGVGSDGDFFALGGHSLLATQVISRVRELLRVELPLRRLFDAPTVAGLARAVEEERRHGTEAPPLRRAPERDRFPLSFAQERLWFLDRMEPESALYNLPIAARLEGRLDEGAFAAALDDVIRRHEALRTTFPLVEEEPVQAVRSAASASLPVIDLRGVRDPLRLLEAARQEMTIEAKRPFDLAAGPLLRPLLLRLDDEASLLLLTVHHIVADGWSLGVLLRDLGAAYGARLRGEAPGWTALPVQYGDFAVWQRDWLRGEALERQLAWWRERLAGLPPVLDLPTDRPRPAVRSGRGGREAVLLPAALLDDLTRLARRRGATLFMVLLAAFQALLARVTGQDDVPVGSPIANRNRRETEELIGFFVNTLVLRTDLADDPAFADLLDRVRETTLGAYDHQDVPFERLVEELKPPRSRSHTPLFQVVLALQNAPLGPLELPGLRLAPFEVETRTAKFDLSLVLVESGGGLGGFLEHDRDLFDATTARRLLGWFRTLLEGGIEDPERRISGLPLLTAPERQQALEQAGGDSPYPRDVGVHELFEIQAASSPDAVAIEMGAEEISYAELSRRSDRVARRLRAWGVTPGTLVGIGMHRSAELIVATLGILKAGGAYVPLLPSLPAERLAWLLEDTGAPVVLTRETDREPLRAAAARLERPPRVAGLEEALADEPGRTLPAELSGTGGGGVACVLYTSGSTGRPKGVVLPHRGIARLVLETDYLRIEPRHRVAHLANPAFDAATFEIWGALLHGARLVGLPQETALAPLRLAAELRARRIDVLLLTTALFHQIAAEAPETFAGLEHLLVGGEALDPAAARRVLERGAPGRLLNVYGPTEATTLATWHPLRPDDAFATVPIGRPIANTTLRLLDRALRPVPVGVAGEIFLGGDGLALGYLGRTDLTAERFVPDPLADDPRARLYRTGDLGRRRADGAVEFLGRRDHQVKIRGFRIEPGEIEAALVRHPGIREALVVPFARAQDRGLAAYFVADSFGGETPPSGRELRAHLEARLPSYMVPSVYLSLEAFPINRNGKVDRGALPPPEGARPDVGALFQAPRTPLEVEIARIWAEALGCREVGIHDNFFELGGHSLLATRLQGRYRQAFGAEVPLRELFEAPTVAEIARRIEVSRQGAAAVEPEIRAVSRQQYRVPRGKKPPRGDSG
jgi:amino acid adenylation domain-containing protein